MARCPNGSSANLCVLECVLDLNKRRWIVILAGVFANICQGAVYAFSVFAPGLTAVLKCSKAELSLAFSLSVAFLPLGMLLGGKVASHRGPNVAVAVGGTVLGLGMLLAGFTQSLLWLYLTYGILMSIGNGMAYGTVVSTAVEWFPERRGFASGIVVSALGIGTLIIAPVADIMIRQLGVLNTFKVLGLLLMVVIIITAQFIKHPPRGYKPADLEALAKATERRGGDVVWNQMIRIPRFWLLHAIYALGVFSGMMVISQAKFIAVESISGISGKVAATLVGILGLANSTGRLFWGWISDRIGRYQAIALMFVITAVIMSCFTLIGSTFVTFVVAIMLVGLCYGGFLGVFPSVTADTFGSKNLTANYAVMFTGFSVAGITGPYFGGKVKDLTGSYFIAFIACAAVAVVGLILTLIAMSRDVKEAGEAQEDVGDELIPEP